MACTLCTATNLIVPCQSCPSSMLTPEVKELSVVQNMEDGAESPAAADSSEEDEDDESQGIMTRLQSTVEATQV